MSILGEAENHEFKPHMSDVEYALLKKYTPQSGTVLEFGAGGSSAHFAESGVKRLTSVEADVAWINQLLLGNTTLRKWVKEKRWKPIYANIGPVESWSMPVDKSPSLDWLNYHQNIWKVIDAGDLDLVLIDGRFRVACALQVLLRIGKNDPTVIIHDFWNRPEYQDLLGFFCVTDKVDTLVVLKKKRRIDWKKVSIHLLDCMFDYR